MRSTWLATLFLVGLAWGQDIVLKASFPSAFFPQGQILELPSIDINNDGIVELRTSYGYFDISNWAMYEFIGDYSRAFVGHIRGLQSFEYLGSSTNPSSFSTVFVRDLSTQEVLLQLTGALFPLYALFDYDLDGLDDAVVYINGVVSVYGIATGNPPISPPQELDIQQVGQDYVIDWSSVPNATAYRIEWSSALDGGVRFTRIGYTTGTTFTHRNQAGQERGFYRVLSEDNGTGVLRMVGSTR
ncbi:MAG: hypothetical protein Q8L64_01300 [bacterium]|nr:hypothetical protein [bacterium]